MATGWALSFLILLGTTSPLEHPTNSFLHMIASASTSEESTTPIASTSSKSTKEVGAMLSTTVATENNSTTLHTTPPTVETTISPEGQIFMNSLLKEVKCRNHKCTPANSVVPTFNATFACYCDPECNLVGECCPQVAPNFPQWKDLTRKVHGVERQYWGCGSLRSHPTPENVSMVVGCPDGHVLELLCEKRTLGEYEYKLDLPVLNADTGVWFQNVYCAVCHGYGQRLRKQYLSFACSAPNGTVLESVPSTASPGPNGTIVLPSTTDSSNSRNIARRDAASIFDNAIDTDGSYESENNISTIGIKHDERNYQYVFNILQQGKYEPGQLVWATPDGGSCHLYPELSPSKEPGDADPWERPCGNLEDHCPPTWTGDQETADLCSAYSYYVVTVGTNPVVYKNPHCARCHNETRKMGCRSAMQRRKNAVGGRAMRPPSLRLIMDYEWDAAREGCGSRGGVWDALHGRCQSLDEACPAGSRYRDGRCVSAPKPSDDSSTAAPNSTLEGREGDEGDGGADRSGGGGGELSQSDSCPLITLAADEFELHNGTLRLTLAGSPFFGLRLRPDEFRLLSDGRALVCNVYQSALLPVDTVQGYLTAVCLAVSALCLVLHLIIHGLLPKLHNLPGKNLQALSAALLLAQLGFLLGVSPPGPVPVAVCETVAAAVHFFYLAAFCWMNVMSVDIWRTFSAATGRTTAHPNATHRRYAAYAWGLPAVVVALSLVADHTHALPVRFRPGYAEAGICWFGSGLGLGIYLAAPITAILVCNIALFMVTVFQLHRRQEGSRYLRKRRHAEQKERLETSVTADVSNCSTRTSLHNSSATGPRDQVRFFLYVKLFIIMGVTWLMGTLASLARWPALWYPFVVLNGLQGAFIFVMFDVKRSVLAMLWERLLDPRPLPEALRSPRSALAADSSRRTGGTATTTAPTTTTTDGGSGRFSGRISAPPVAEENCSNADKNGTAACKTVPEINDEMKTENGLQTLTADISNDSTSKSTSSD